MSDSLGYITHEQLKVAHNFLLKNYKGLLHHIERLEEAMAPQEQIDQDIKMVGGFVSRINLLITEEEVIDQAIQFIKEHKGKK